ncbi:MAG: hypothetical protein PHD76_15005 [Methylacidiphilales bacterium]|nr:hypothetical protein [Candidatus Methylacidiphilales bacterium]
MNHNPLHDWLRTLGILLIGISAFIATLRYCGIILTKNEKQSLALIQKMQSGMFQEAAPAPPPFPATAPVPSAPVLPRAEPINGN